MLAAGLAEERRRSEQAAEGMLAKERDRSERMLAAGLAEERRRSEQAAERMLAEERRVRAAVAGHLADRGLSLRRLLLIFTIHRSGSTWLFDLLRTHPAVRLDPTTRAWAALGLEGWRYPGAFHHAAGAVLPLEFKPGRWTEIPSFPRACIPGAENPGEADRWALEKAHPEFAGFDAERLAARILDLRGKGVEVEIVYGVRKPLDAMWSMAEYKTREPAWYKHLPMEEVPRFFARSFDSLARMHTLMEGSVVDYRSLPDGAAMKALCRRLAPSWGEAESAAWLSHAVSATCRSKRRQREASGFLGTRDRSRHPAGPGGAWAAGAAEIKVADAVWRRLTAEDGER